jgi:hypothetical protein
MPNDPDRYTVKLFDRKTRKWNTEVYDTLEEAKKVADDHNAGAEVLRGWDLVYKP